MGLAKAGRITCAVAAMAWAATPALAQEGEDDDEEDDGPTPVAEFVEDFDAFEGLFPIYQDPENGKIYMEISADQMDEEFIYFVYSMNAAPGAGGFRGLFRDNAVLRFERHFDKIEIVEVNTAFYFDPENALARASEANLSDAPLVSVPIKAETLAEEPEDDEDEDETVGEDTDDGDDAAAEDDQDAQADDETPSGQGSILIEASFLMGDGLHQVSPSGNPNAGPFDFRLGKLNRGQTKVEAIKNYPENTDLVIEYVFKADTVRNGGGAAITDARAVEIDLQHSFIAMPDDGYRPRYEDYRIGYFTDAVTDLTDPEGYAPYRDMINRWRLEKKDPTAAISDPVKPITWWIENTTPVELRDAVRRGALAWNEAFEAAGFSNAIEVKVQPDDADWDAGDIRYNVLRWTSSPNPPFGGYGPSFTNPRTGEIIGADIMLEFVYVTNRVRLENVFENAAMAHAQGPVFSQLAHDHRFCSMGAHMQQELALATIVNAVGAGSGKVDPTELIEQGVAELTLHEIGHTLGLAHNMKSTSGIDLDTMHDGGPLAGSIMDYNAVNLAPESVEQGKFYSDTPGPYDVWAIEWGYTPFDTPEEEAERLAAIAARSTDPLLAFGNDTDDMRSPGGGIDPRTMIGDLSDDSVRWAAQHMTIIDNALLGLKDQFTIPGETWEPLRDSYFLLTGQRAGAARAASRWIGGVFVERFDSDQPGATVPFTPVPRAKQEEALQVLSDFVFAPGAMSAEESLYPFLQSQRRGWSLPGSGEDPRIHERALGVQVDLLNHLTHPTMLRRMTNARLYGGEYPVAEYMEDLTDVIFEADIHTTVDTMRQQLQVVYTTRLLAVIGSEQYDPVSRSAALASLKAIKSMTAPGLLGQSGQNAETKAHRDHLFAVISAADVI